MPKPNKFICVLVASAFFLNILAPSASACWWKSAMIAHGSPEINGTPSQQQGNNTNKRNQAASADPIFLHNGDFFYESLDLFIPSRGIPLELKHTYKSQSVMNNRFGCGWDLSHSQRIVPLSNGDAYYFNGANMRLRFSYLDGKNYVSPVETYDQLIQNSDGTWALTKKHGEKYYFNQNGLITKIEDRHKNAITFSYNSQGKSAINGIPYYPATANPGTGVIAYDWQLSKITDSAGRETNLAYDGNGRLTTITDFSGRVVKYTYDINGDLLNITKPATTDFPQGTTVTFTYTNHKLTSIKDAKGQTYLTNFYNGQGMVDAQEYAGNKVYLTYDTVNKKTTVKDAKNFSTIYTFNDQGNPIKKQVLAGGLRTGEPSSYVTTNEYNTHLELTKVIYPRGNSILYTYDEKGNLLEIRRKPQSGSTEADIVTTFTYESLFNFIKTAKDSLGNTTTYYYDYDEASLGDLNGDGVTNGDKGNLVKISYPAVAGQTPQTKFTYNSYGQLLTVVDPNANVTKYEYNSTGYLSKVTNAYGSLNLATEMAYDSVGNVKTIKDPKGNIATFDYDSHNNLTKTTAASPFSYVTNFKYDANNNLIQLDRQTGDTSNPWQTTYYTYDMLDRLATTKDELSNITTFTYDANGNRSSIKDANLNTTNYSYDERNLLWKVTDALGNTTEYAYDENGNLKEINDAKANKTTYVYDGFDRLLKTAYADSSFEEYTYDAASNLISKKDPKAQIIYYDYDALNRLSEKGLSPQGTVPGSVVSYTYDKGSRLTDVVDSTGTIHYAYDAANRIIQVTTQGLSPQGTVPVSYEYDANSNRTKLTYPDASYISYSYDELNRLTAIKNQSGVNIAGYTYDALSRRTQATLANNTRAAYAYDAINRLTSLTNTYNPAPNTYTYTYDKVGNRKTMATAGGTHTYTYDNIYQLKNVDYPTGYPFTDTSFNYDTVGNRATGYTANNLNQYTKVGTTDYAYDTNGSLTSDGTFTYAYDYENRLTSASKTGTSATYKYDPFGRRIEKTVNSTTTKFLYDGDQIIAEYDGSGNLIAKYAYGAGIDEVISLTKGSNTYYYHYDGLGSVTALTNSTGQTSETYSYDAFGKPNTASSIGNTRMFTGREYDSETGLYYYRARYYSPTLGRFLQRDPVGYSAGINLYSYCSNNPINFVDPMGLDKQQAWWKEAWDWMWYNLLEPPYNTLFYPGSNYGEWIWGEKNLRNFYGASLDAVWLATGIYGAIEAVAASGAPYWQYYPANNQNYPSPYMTRGWQPPYQTGKEAYDTLRLDLAKRANPGTAVRQIKVNWWERVAGPGRVKGGTGWEYFRGRFTFPKD